MNPFAFPAALLGTILLTGTIAMAQPAGMFDPHQLPVFRGRVAQYDLTPRGDVGGVILEDGTEVLMPPPLGSKVVAAVKPGDAVTIHGLKAQSLPLVQAMSLANDATGATVVDAGPPGGPPGGRPPPGNREPGSASAGGPPANRPPPRGPEPMEPSRGGGSPMDAHGVIKAQLHGRQGELNGVLLQDGTIIRMPPPQATQIADRLAPGRTIFVRGEGKAGDLGKWIDAKAIGTSADTLVRIEPPQGQRPPPPQ